MNKHSLIYLFYLIFFFSISSCRNSSEDEKVMNENDDIDHLSAEQRQFQGVWVQEYPESYQTQWSSKENELVHSPGIYTKIKFKNGILKIWYDVGGDVFLEEFKKFECKENKCIPSDPIGEYHHHLHNSVFIIQKSERFIVKGKLNYFTEPEGSYFIKLNPISYNRSRYFLFESINTQAEKDLPGQ